MIRIGKQTASEGHFSRGENEYHLSTLKITVFQITCHEALRDHVNRLSHILWRGMGRTSFSFPTALFRQTPRLVRQAMPETGCISGTSQVSSEIEALIVSIRSSPPVRRVSGRAKDVTGCYRPVWAS